MVSKINLVVTTIQAFTIKKKRLFNDKPPLQAAPPSPPSHYLVQSWMRTQKMQLGELAGCLLEYLLTQFHTQND